MRRRPLYYGWRIVVTLGLTETVSWGILYYAFTVFLTPMGADLAWSRTATSGAFSLALLVSAAAVPVRSPQEGSGLVVDGGRRPQRDLTPRCCARHDNGET